MIFVILNEVSAGVHGIFCSAAYGIVHYILLKKSELFCGVAPCTAEIGTSDDYLME